MFEAILLLPLAHSRKARRETVPPTLPIQYTIPAKRRIHHDFFFEVSYSPKMDINENWLGSMGHCKRHMNTLPLVMHCNGNGMKSAHGTQIGAFFIFKNHTVDRWERQYTQKHRLGSFWRDAFNGKHTQKIILQLP